MGRTDLVSPPPRSPKLAEAFQDATVRVVVVNEVLHAAG
jgi:hypothetical protein